MKSPLVRLFGLAALAVFFLTDLAWGELKKKEFNPETLQIPPSLGSIQADKTHPADPPQTPFILHIQNAHGNYEAQVRIRELLRLLHDQYGFNTLFVEGARGKLRPDLLRLFSDKKLNLALADSLTKQGELTGVEYYLIDAPQTVEGIGIERPDLYRANLEALQRVEAAKPESEKFLQTSEREWSRLASSLLSQESRRILSEWKKFNDGSRDFFPYAKRLAENAKKVLGLDLEKLSAQVEWPQLTRLLVLGSVESELDWRAVKVERRKLIRFLRAQKSAPELISAFQKTEPESPRALFEKLLQEAGPRGFSFRDYPALSRWAGWRILESELETRALFEEVDRILVEILKKLSPAPRERELLELDHDLALLKKLLSLELSREDWERVLARQDLIEPKAIRRRLAQLGGKSAGPENSLAEIFESALRFYEMAEAREHAFEEIITREMKDRKLEKAVLITGGFHTEGMRESLRERGISYESLLPRFSKDEGVSPYWAAMFEKTPTAFDLASVEEPAKMQGRETLLALGRSGRAEAKVIAADFLEIAKRSNGIPELGRLWEDFAKSPYAKDRGIQMESVAPSSPEKLIFNLKLPSGKFEITFHPAEKGFGFQMKNLGGPIAVTPLVPGKSAAPPAGQETKETELLARSEVRASVPFHHVPVKTDPEGDHVNEPTETVNLNPLGLEKWLPYVTPFEARIIQAFLYSRYAIQPQAILASVFDERQDRNVQTFIYPEFEGNLTDLEVKTFLRTLYEVQEAAKKEGGKFDKETMVRMMADVYWSRVNRYDRREETTEWPPEVLNIERQKWPRIFEGLVKKVLEDRGLSSPLEPLGVVRMGGFFQKKNYIQVLPAGTTAIEFLPGKFPKRGISVVLGNRQAVFTAVYRKSWFREDADWLIRYEQDPKQNVVFPKAGGYVVIGTDPFPHDAEGKRIIVPTSQAVAPSHATLGVAIWGDGILRIHVSDGTAVGPLVDRVPSGKTTFVEYPDLQRVFLPLSRAEVRGAEALTGRQLEEVKSGPRTEVFSEQVRNASFVLPDLFRIQTLPVALQIPALAHGIIPITSPQDLKILEALAAAQTGTLPEAFQEIEKAYPWIRASEAPGALVLVTDKIPNRSELRALRSLLLSQKNEFLRLVFPEEAVSKGQMDWLERSAERIFNPVRESVGPRFGWVRIKTGEQLGEVPREIYRLMKEKGVTLGSVRDLETHHLVEWFDEGVARYLDISGSTDPYAKIMRSDLGNEFLYSELRLWGAAGGMKISQGVPAREVDRLTQALQPEGRFIHFRVTDALRGLVADFMKALQVTLRFAQAA